MMVNRNDFGNRNARSGDQISLKIVAGAITVLAAIAGAGAGYGDLRTRTDEERVQRERLENVVNAQAETNRLFREQVIGGISRMETKLDMVIQVQKGRVQ